MLLFEHQLVAIKVETVEDAGVEDVPRFEGDSHTFSLPERVHSVEAIEVDTDQIDLIIA